VLLLARARQDECWGLSFLGDAKNALVACAEAQKIEEELGNRGELAVTLQNTGMVYRDSGNLPAAEAAYRKALAVHAEAGSESGRAVTLGHLGSVLRRMGKLDQAKVAYEEAIAIEHRFHRELDEAIGLGNLGRVLFEQGDVAGAQQRYEQALEISRRLDSMKRSGVYTLGNLAMVLTVQGKLDEARKLWEQARDIMRETKSARGEISATDYLGDIALKQNDLPRAKKYYDESTRLRKQHGWEKDPEQLLSAATLALVEDRLKDAEQAAREAVAAYAKAGDAEEALPQELLAEALLDQGKVKDARQAIDRARSFTPPDRDGRLKMAITAARVQAAEGATAQALQALDAVRVEGVQHGATEPALLARMWAVRLGDVGRRAAALKVLAAEAHAQGFPFLAAQCGRTPSR
jgi:tetratricopeptide (TPR) repeat protein